MVNKVNYKPGDRFKLLTIITFTGIKAGKKRYLCKCDCGQSKEVSGTNLSAGITRSCGCLKQGRKEKECFIGKKFDRLLVIGQISRSPITYECRCDCGILVKVTKGKLRKNLHQHCGCDKNRPLITFLYYQYKGNALARGLSFDLTRDEFLFLIKNSCFYCDLEPKNVLFLKRYGKKYVYNGIDRHDNSQGYTKNNCVSCCKFCNMAKGQSKAEDFLNWLTEASKRISNRSYTK